MIFHHFCGLPCLSVASLCGFQLSRSNGSKWPLLTLSERLSFCHLLRLRCLPDLFHHLCAATRRGARLPVLSLTRLPRCRPAGSRDGRGAALDPRHRARQGIAVLPPPPGRLADVPRHLAYTYVHGFINFRALLTGLLGPQLERPEPRQDPR